MLGNVTAGSPQAVYVVSDGNDTCDGDPIAAARALHGGETAAVVNVIGFDWAAADRAELMAVAKAGGGMFSDGPRRTPSIAKRNKCNEQKYLPGIAQHISRRSPSATWKSGHAGDPGPRKKVADPSFDYQDFPACSPYSHS